MLEDPRRLVAEPFHVPAEAVGPGATLKHIGLGLLQVVGLPLALSRRDGTGASLAGSP